MNTPAHLIFGTAAFGKPGNARVTCAAVLGALSPDLSLYLMVAWARWVQDVPARTVFREYYYSDEWQAVFAVDNSFVLWGVAFGLAMFVRNRIAIAFCGAALLHLAFDFPLHNHDARQHFWPLTDWVFISPLSYWDSRHFGHWIEPVEVAVALAIGAVNPAEVS